MKLLILNYLISISVLAGSFSVPRLNDAVNETQNNSVNKIEEHHEQQKELGKKLAIEFGKKLVSNLVNNINNQDKTIDGQWKLNKSGTVTSGERANSSSKGQSSFFGSYEVCFYFNNTGELDNDSSLYLYQDRNSNNHTKESRSWIGQHLIKACAKGSEMGGKWNFRYSTKNDTRTGSFPISGECHRYDVDLNKGDWYNDDSIKIDPSNCSPFQY